MDNIVSQHKMMLEGKLLKNITFNSGSVQEETVSESTMSKTTMQLEQKIENKNQSGIDDVSDKSGSQGHWNWPRLFSIFMFNFGTMWGIVGTYNSYNSDAPGLTEHWVEVMKTMEILQVLSITTINLLYGCQDKTESHLIYHSDLASFVLISLLCYQARVVVGRY